MQSQLPRLRLIGTAQLGRDPRRIAIGGGQQTAVSMILPDEGPFEAIVMPGEALYATLDDDAANAPFQLKVFEVGS